MAQVSSFIKKNNFGCIIGFFDDSLKNPIFNPQSFADRHPPKLSIFFHLYFEHSLKTQIFIKNEVADKNPQSLCVILFCPQIVAQSSVCTPLYS